MAKSIRSKWKRKCRAVKRVRYGKKELERLKKTLGIEDKNDVDMINLMETANIIQKTAPHNDNRNNDEPESMDTNQKRIFNPKTMRDQHGSYPVWMNQRRIRKNRKIEKKKNKKKHNSKM